MKIAILADPVDHQRAGIHRYTVEMIRSFLLKDKANSYLLFRGRKFPTFPGAKSVVVPKLRWTLIFPAIRLFWVFGHLARRFHADVVIEPAHFGPFSVPRKAKRVTIIHDLTPLKYPEFHRFHSYLLQAIFLKRIIRKADLVITNSENSRLDIIRQFPFSEKKVESIYLGKGDAFRPVKDPQVLEQLGITGPFFLSVGTIEPRKNLILLLNAYKLFRMNHPEPYQLVIVGGKGWKSAGFYRKLARHPFRADILLTGYVPEEDLPVLYSATHAFIYPSFYEGFGLPVLEAMACGAPCVVSNTSSLPEVTGTAALLFNPFSLADLDDQLMLIGQNESLRHELSEKSLKRAAMFSWESFATQFLQALDRFNID